MHPHSLLSQPSFMLVRLPLCVRPDIEIHLE
jgi:hypothetical protein